MGRLWVLLVACAGCSGGDGGGADGCRSDTECLGDELCVGPDAPQPCGQGPTEECGSAGDCWTFLDCHAIPDACSLDGVGSHCASPCDEGYTSCAAGYTCTSAGCRPEVCTSDGDCPDHQRCAGAGGSLVHQLTNGCVDRDCTADADCGTGACVNLACQSGPGTCESSEPVP